MSRKNVFQGAQNSGSTFIAADFINYYTSAGNRATSDAAIPIKPNSSIRFTGRTNILAKLKEHFTAESNDILHQQKFFLLYGMGGIGKTQICLRFIEEMSDYFSHVFWIDASSTDTITQGLKGICNLPEAQSSALDGSSQSALWWINSLGKNYAMVFDNADALTPEELEQYIPSGLGGNILIASRNPSLRYLTSHGNSCEVREMEENNAISLLLKAACLDESQEDLQAEASKIVKELFCIPLAIDQAGTFIAFGDTDIRDYLKKYSQHRKWLLDYPAFKGASKYNRTVYQTWELSYEEIQQRAKSDDSQRAEAASSAMLLLAMFSFLHFDGISEEIFSYAATLEHERNRENKEISALPLASSVIDHTLLQLDRTGKWDNSVFKEGIQVLLSFNLIKLGSLKGVYTIHPLVHTWGQDRMSSEDKEKYSLMAYGMLAGCLPEDFEKQPDQFRKTLVSHLTANIVMGKNKMVERYFDDAHEKFGRLLREQENNSEAEKFQIEVLDARTRTLGKEHPDTIHAMGDLAITYERLGNYADAEKLQIEVLDLHNRCLGKEHPYTVSAMSNLAITYENLGKYADAARLQMKVLDLSNRFLGEEHPNTIMAMGDLANTYKGMRNYADAEKLDIKVLDLRSRVFGEEHPNTILAMDNLANTYHGLENYADAEKLKIKVLDLQNKYLGKGHPQTIVAMSNLAFTQMSLGKYADAKKLQITVLDLRQRLLGEEHPDTITAVSNLAAINVNVGKYADAKKLQIKVVDLRQKLLGKEHPDTFTAVSNLAAINQALGKYADAAKLQMKVLDLINKLLREEHPDTILAMVNLANTYNSLEKYTDAEQLSIRVLELRNRLLGEEHPDTILVMGNLANTYHSLGKYADAEMLQIKVLDLRNRLLGEEHSDTILAMGNLAYTYQSLGKYGDAEKLKIKVLDLKSRLLGEEHPDMINAMENLAITFYYLQKYVDAARLEVRVVDARKKFFGEEHPKTVKAVAILAEIRSQSNRYTSGIESRKKSDVYLLWNLVISLIFNIRLPSFGSCK